MVMHAYNPITEDTKTEGFWVQGEPELFIKSKISIKYIGRLYLKKNIA